MNFEESIRSPFLGHNALLNFRRTEQAVLTFSRPIVLCRSVASAEKAMADLEERDSFVAVMLLSI